MSSHPAFQKYGKFVDKFRDEPDNKASPTLIGVFLTVICVPALLSVYFWYIYTTNGTVYNTTIIKATDSTWLGYVTCQAPGGCWYAAVDTYYNCEIYNDGLINYVPYGQDWYFKSIGRSGVLFSDNSNIDTPNAYALLLVGSVNMSALQVNHNGTLPTQTLWNIGFDGIYLGQSAKNQANISYFYDGKNENAVEYDVLGTNDQYSIQMTISMTSLTDKLSRSVQNADTYNGATGVTISQFISPTFAMNRDMIGSCASRTYDPITEDGIFNATQMPCDPPMACVTATVVIDPLVTSTTISKEYSLTALFAQVGGNASNVIVILSVMLTGFHYLEGRFGRPKVDPNRVTPISNEPDDGTGGKKITVSTRASSDV